jgi:hypothetical protein
MDIDLALTLFAFASFVVLCVSWILAPLRAAAPTALPLADSAPSRTAVAA